MYMYMYLHSRIANVTYTGIIEKTESLYIREYILSFDKRVKASGKFLKLISKKRAASGKSSTSVCIDLPMQSLYTKF